MKTPHHSPTSAILAAPAAHASTGICRFCARTLTDPRSIAAGCGAECAALHGVDYPQKARRRMLRRPARRRSFAARLREAAEAAQMLLKFPAGGGKEEAA